MSFDVVMILLGLEMLSALTCPVTTPVTGNPLVSFTTQSKIDTLANGYDWEVWSEPDPSKSLGTITLYNVNATFRADWNDTGNFLARVGHKFEKAGKTGCSYTEYGKIVAEYSYKKAPPENATEKTNDLAGVFSYIGIYGWARNPLVNFYIIDDWFGNEYQFDYEVLGKDTVCYVDGVNPTVDCQVGTYNVDGSEYKIYKRTSPPAHSIDGENTVFDQYFSIRQNIRNCGTINVDEHFKKWGEQNPPLPLNELYETKLLVQAGGGEGWIDYNYATVTTANECFVDPPEEEEEGPGGAWNKRAAWVPMVALWVILFLCL